MNRTWGPSCSSGRAARRVGIRVARSDPRRRLRSLKSSGGGLCSDLITRDNTRPSMARSKPRRRRRREALTNVAPEDTALIGRVVDRAALADLFNEGARLVSVVGAGGIGKTRLATSFAAEQLGAYAGCGDGGVWFCDLTHARTI